MLLAGACRFAELVEHGLHDHGYRHQAADRPALAQRVYLALRGFKHRVGLAGALVHHVVYLVRRLAQAAQQRAVTHDGGVLKDVRGGGRDAHYLREVILVAVLIHAAHLHLVEHGDGVDGLPVGEHGVHRLIYIAVELYIKLVRLQFFKDLRYAPRVDEHGADDGLLSGGGMGRLVCPAAPPT